MAAFNFVVYLLLCLTPGDYIYVAIHNIILLCNYLHVACLQSVNSFVAKILLVILAFFTRHQKEPIVMPLFGNARISTPDNMLVSLHTRAPSLYGYCTAAQTRKSC